MSVPSQQNIPVYAWGIYSLFFCVVVGAEEARLMSFRVETGHWERRLPGVLYERPTLHPRPISGAA